MKEKEEESLALEIAKRIFVSVPEFMAEKVLLAIQGISDLWIRTLLYGAVILLVVVFLICLRWLGGLIPL
jgi:hypothetical protein